MFGIVLTLISQISLVFSLSCLDSEWGVIVSTIEPFETNGTGLFTGAVQNAMEYCCYHERPGLSVSKIRSETDLIANRLIWDSTFLYYPTTYKLQNNFIPVLKSPGAVLITKSPLVINYFKQLLNSGWPYIVLIIVIVIFAGTSLWALTPNHPNNSSWLDLIGEFLSGLILATTISLRFSYGASNRGNLVTQFLTLFWTLCSVLTAFIVQLALLIWILEKLVSGNSDMKVGVVKNSPEKLLSEAITTKIIEFEDVSQLIKNFHDGLIEAILTERHLSDHYDLPNNFVTKFYSNYIEYGALINRNLNETLADCLSIYLQLNQKGFLQQLSNSKIQINKQKNQKVLLFTHDNIVPWLTQNSLPIMSGAVLAAILMLILIRCALQSRRKTTGDSKDVIQSLYNQLLITGSEKQRNWQSNLGRYDQVLVGSDFSQNSEAQKPPNNLEGYQLPAANKFRSWEHSVLDSDQRSNCSSTKDLMAKSLLSLAATDKPNDNVVFYRCLRPNSNVVGNNYLELHL